MIFGGIHENSMIDFPGRLSCVLFAFGCNFRCPYCHNPSLVNDPISLNSFLDIERIIEFLSDRKGFLEGVVISGGEPTLQPSLLSVCAKIKKLGYSIKLDTNGSQPTVINALIAADLIDYIAMDIKGDPHQYASFIHNAEITSSILSSIQLILSSGITHEFRTTCLSPFIDLSVIQIITELIKGADLFALQRFRTTQVLEPEFFVQEDRCIDEQTLLKFQEVAINRVKRCIIR
jgi:pyruvate formate lyase activating enzyme